MPSGVAVAGGGDRVLPGTSDRKISANLPGKKEARKKWTGGGGGGGGEEKNDNCKRVGGKMKMEGETVPKGGNDFFFRFCVFFLFCFSFSKRLKLV